MASIKIKDNGSAAAVKKRRSFRRPVTGPVEPETSPITCIYGRFSHRPSAVYGPKRGRVYTYHGKTIRFVRLTTSVVRFAAHYRVEPSIVFRADRRAPQDDNRMAHTWRRRCLSARASRAPQRGGQYTAHRLPMR